MFALLIVHTLLASAPPGGEGSLWLLESACCQREEAALLYALRIYTRDLKVPIAINKAPSRAQAREGQQAGAKLTCALGAAIVVWFAGETAAPELSVLRCRAEDEYRFPLRPAKDLNLAAQTLALKIRGLLMDATPAEAEDDDLFLVPWDLAQPEPPEAAVAVGPKAEEGKAVGVGQTGNPVHDTGIVAGETKQRAQAPGALGRPNWALGGGMEWALGAGNSFSGLRQGLLLRLLLVSTQLPLALELDGSFVTSVTRNYAWGHLTVSEIPIGIAMSARLTRSSWTVACGPRVALHRIQADGDGPDGRSGSATNTAAGLGALEQVLYNASETFSLALSLSNEAIVPRQRYTIDGRNGLDVGRFQWTISAGVVVHP